MATYTNIEGQGKLTTAPIAGSTTITITPPASLTGDSYFTLEATRNTNGFYGSTSPKLAGIFSNLNGVSNIVSDTYKFSAVIEEGGGSFDYTPTSTISIGDAYVRGTGDISVDIS